MSAALRLCQKQARQAMRLTLLASTGLMALPATPVLAQMAGNGAAQAEKAPGAGMEDIVVTARRRAEGLMDVPVAVSALGAGDIARYAASDLSKIGQLVPQVIIARSSGAGSGASFVIRGVGSSQGDTGIDQTVSLSLDGIQLSRGRAIGQGFFDIAQVEVMKGPQALFFGKNSPGGVIAVTSAGPTDDFEAYVRAGYEFRADERFLEGVVSGPVTETLGVRLAVRGSQTEGYIRNLARPMENPRNPAIPLPGASDSRQPGGRDLLGRLTVVYEPGSGFDATLKVFASSRKENGTAFSEVHGCSGRPVTLGTLVDPTGDCRLDGRRSVSDLPDTFIDGLPRARDGELYSKNDFVLTLLSANYSFSDVTLTSVTGLYGYKFSTLDEFTFASTGGLWSTLYEKYRAVSQEVRATTDFDGPLNFTLGGIFEKNRRDNETANIQAFLAEDPATGKHQGSETHVRTHGKTWSLFGQARYDILENLELAAGVRWTREVKDTAMANNYIHPSQPPGTRRAADLLLNADYRDENWSPEATLTWRPTPGTTLYAAYKTGYKSGGFSTPQGGVPATWTSETPIFGAETAEGGEIGAKAELFGRSLRVNATVYSYTFDDLQQTSLNALTFLYTVRNAARARTRGIELDVTWMVNDELTLRASGSYNRARYAAFPLSPCWTGQTAEQGCVGGVQDLSGTQLARAPDWMATAGFRYERPLGTGLMFGLSGDINYTSAYWMQETQNPSARQSGFARLDASARLYEEDNAWELALIGRNLTNKWYGVASVDRPLGAIGEVAVGTGRPREVLLQATYRFR